MPLLKSQKNALLLAIREYGMNPGDFSPTMNSHGDTKLVHNPSEYYLAIDTHREPQFLGVFSCVYAPGQSASHGTQSHVGWNSILILFEKWLGYLKREITQPDLWEALAQSHFPDTPSEDNSPFSEPERQAIEERLGQIRDYAYQVLPSLAEQPEWGRRLEAKIDYLAESSGRMERKDWFTLFAGVILPFTLSGAMDSEAAKDFLAFAWQIMYQVLPSLTN